MQVPGSLHTHGLSIGGDVWVELLSGGGSDDLCVLCPICMSLSSCLRHVREWTDNEDKLGLSIFLPEINRIPRISLVVS